MKNGPNENLERFQFFSFLQVAMTTKSKKRQRIVTANALLQIVEVQNGNQRSVLLYFTSINL